MVQETMESIIPFLIIIIPLLPGIAVFFTGSARDKRDLDGAGLAQNTAAASSAGGQAALRNILLMAGTLVPFGLSLYLQPIVAGGTVVQSRFDILPPLGLLFRVDILGQYMGLLFTFFGFIIVLYSIGYMKEDPLPQRFFGFLLLVFSGSLGVVLAGDLFTLFLFFEFMSIMYFVLVVHDATPGAVAAGVKFLFMTIVAGVALFLAVVIVFREAGSLALNTPGLIDTYSTLALLAFIGFFIAFGTKTAMFPLHFWMPDAYSQAPLPAALLSSAIMLKTGAYGFIRVFYNVFSMEFLQTVNWDQVMIVVAAFTVLFGSTIAIAQDDIIRRLAYSGIAQIGYIVLGTALLVPNALAGATFHLMAHAFMKGCMFLCMGAVIKATGNRSIRKMKGVGFQVPLPLLAFTVAAVTAVGIPPFNVFISKWHLSLGALDVNQLWLVIVLLISSMLNAAYYLPISYHAFMGLEEGAHGAAGHHGSDGDHGSGGEHHSGGHHGASGPRFKLSPLLLIPILALTLGCLVFGLPTQNWPLDIVRSITEMLI